VAAGSRKAVPIGRVVGVFGVRGWLRIRSDTEPRAGILEHPIWLVGGEGQWREHALVDGRVHGSGLVACLEGIDERETARAFVGRDIAVDRDALPELEEGEYYWIDLVGLEVRSVAGEVFGTVTQVMETGANDVLVVRGRREWLVPYLPGSVVRRVDLDAGTIEVEWDFDWEQDDAGDREPSGDEREA